MIPIDEVPESYRIIKIIIRETFGEYQTYLNQIFIYAKVGETETSKSQSVYHHNFGDELRKLDTEELSEMKEQSQEESDYHQNAAVLTISKNMIVMED